MSCNVALPRNVIIDPTAKATPLLRSWKSESYNWSEEVPAGTSALLIDGPGTSHPRARNNEYHDEYIWLPAVELDDYRCSFDLELNLEPQRGHPPDLGRHGGLQFGVSRAYHSGFWVDAPRMDMTDGLWVGWWPGGLFAGNIAMTGGKIVAVPKLSDKPSRWVLEVYQKNVQIWINGQLVVSWQLEEGLLGKFLGFWRARSEHVVTVHNLVVEELSSVLVTCAVTGRSNSKVSLDCSLASGDKIGSLEADADSPISGLQDYVATLLEAPWTRPALVCEDGTLIDQYSRSYAEVF
eukprot:TRINITY_DN12456_c0_g1_i7.p1 TRINITY_DN12456_c0_g1~~TRINITY_DN12456_c0_g1_i7.p1  ORF type:complete len:294 (-),score=32.68 TRINITY_DN12456_c0_g1_i7:294-1175(-)